MTNEQLAARIKAGIDTSENMLQLWQQMKGFIHKIAMHYQGIADVDDLDQEGYLALYDAVDGYDAESGYKFITYAKYWINQRMMRYIQKDKAVSIPVNKQAAIWKYKKFVSQFLASVGRQPTHRETGTFLGLSRQQVADIEKASDTTNVKSIDVPLSDDRDASSLYELIPGEGNMEDDVIDRLDHENMKHTLWQCVDSLEGKQPRLIRLIYEGGMNREEAGAEIGIDKNAVRLQEQKALKKLRYGKNVGLLRPYYEEYIKTHAYDRGTEWDSITERLALDLIERKYKNRFY